MFSRILACSFFENKFGLHQVGDPQPGPSGLVTVSRPDPALGRSDFGVSLAQLALFVERAVIRQHQVGAIADQKVLANLDSDLAQARDFSDSATGSTTTPLPITQILPRRRMPEGMRCRIYFFPP